MLTDARKLMSGANWEVVTKEMTSQLKNGHELVSACQVTSKECLHDVTFDMLGVDPHLL